MTYFARHIYYFRFRAYLLTLINSCQVSRTLLYASELSAHRLRNKMVIYAGYQALNYTSHRIFTFFPTLQK